VLVVPMGLVLHSASARRPAADRRLTGMRYWWCWC